MTPESKPDAIGEAIGADTDALRTLSSADLRPLNDTIATAATRLQAARAGAQNQPSEGIIMTANRNKTRWLRVATAVAILTLSGAVFAATQGHLFSIWVDTDGKSDQEVTDEIRDQLLHDGVQEPEVEFDREGERRRIRISGSRDGERFKVVRKELGDHDSTVITMEPPRLDTEREPGMSDRELEAKIQAQLDELGIQGTVTVDGDRVKVIAKKTVECDEESCQDDEDDDDDDGPDDDDADDDAPAGD